MGQQLKIFNEYLFRLFTTSFLLPPPGGRGATKKLSVAIRQPMALGPLMNNLKTKQENENGKI